MSFIKHVKQLNCFCLHPCTDGNGLARQLSRKDLLPHPSHSSCYQHTKKNLSVLLFRFSGIPIRPMKTNVILSKNFGPLIFYALAIFIQK